LAGTSTTVMPSCARRAVSGAPRPPAPSIAQHACGDRSGKTPQLLVTRRTDRHPHRGHRLQRRRHHRRRPRRLCGSTAITTRSVISSLRDTQPPHEHWKYCQQATGRAHQLWAAVAGTQAEGQSAPPRVHMCQPSDPTTALEDHRSPQRHNLVDSIQFWFGFYGSLHCYRAEAEKILRLVTTGWYRPDANHDMGPNNPTSEVVEFELAASSSRTWIGLRVNTVQCCCC